MKLQEMGINQGENEEEEEIIQDIIKHYEQLEKQRYDEKGKFKSMAMKVQDFFGELGFYHTKRDRKMNAINEVAY